MSKDRRARATGRLGVKEGERYALIPEEVMLSAAYNAQPDYAKVVLVAVACRFNGHNNGNLSMPFTDARKLGIPHRWKLYGALQTLRKAGLIEMTRQGRLEGGTKVCSLYAITWRTINPAPEGVSYDAGVVVRSLPSNEWAMWERPDNWSHIVRDVASALHGQKKDSRFILSGRQLRSTTVGTGRSTSGGTVPTINPVPTTVGTGRSTSVGSKEPNTAQLAGVQQGAIPDPTLVVSSKTSPLFPRTTRRQTQSDGPALQVNGNQTSNKRSRVSETPQIHPQNTPKSRAPKHLNKLAKATTRSTERTH